MWTVLKNLHFADSVLFCLLLLYLLLDSWETLSLQFNRSRYSAVFLRCCWCCSYCCCSLRRQPVSDAMECCMSLLLPLIFSNPRSLKLLWCLVLLLFHCLRAVTASAICVHLTFEILSLHSLFSSQTRWVKVSDSWSNRDNVECSWPVLFIYLLLFPHSYNQILLMLLWDRQL